MVYISQSILHLHSIGLHMDIQARLNGKILEGGGRQEDYLSEAPTSVGAERPRKFLIYKPPRWPEMALPERSKLHIPSHEIGVSQSAISQLNV